MSELAMRAQRSHSRSGRKSGLTQQHRSQNLDDLVNKQQTFGKRSRHNKSPSPNNFDTSDSRLNDDNLLGEIQQLNLSNLNSRQSSINNKSKKRSREGKRSKRQSTHFLSN